jgi:hypothetical protein
MRSRLVTRAVVYHGSPGNMRYIYGLDVILAFLEKEDLGA